MVRQPQHKRWEKVWCTELIHSSKLTTLVLTLPTTC